jgi:predicted RNase H-like nuclease
VGKEVEEEVFGDGVNGMDWRRARCRCTIRPMHSHPVGVDGCKFGWLAAAYDPDSRQFTFTTHADLSSLLVSYFEAASIAVDIPIGLTESFQPRRCDQLARRLVGSRSSSIFPAPDRRLLQFSTYSEASTFSRELSAKGLTRQSFAILNKIAQADFSMSPKLQSRVFEVHPEVCFLAAAGHNQLSHPKRKSAGFEERRAILERVFVGVAIPARHEAAGLLRGVGPDDVLDAIVAAWTAWRHARGVCKRIPESPELDARGLRMEMVY